MVTSRLETNQPGERKISPEIGKHFSVSEIAEKGVQDLNARERSGYGRESEGRKDVIAGARVAVDSLAGNISYAGVPDFKKKQMAALLAGIPRSKKTSQPEGPDQWGPRSGLDVRQERRAA